MSVTQAQLQEMLRVALDNWDFEAADEPYSEMAPTIQGMIGADLSGDEELIGRYVAGPDDWDGLQNYVLVLMGRF